MSVEVKQISAFGQRSLGKVVVVAGVTASGKTSYAKQLARNLLEQGKRPVFINVDSMQVYMELSVGSNKGEVVQSTNSAKGLKLDQKLAGWYYADLPEVPIELVNIVSIYSKQAAGFNVAQFQKLARETISSLLAADSRPILVGGSGLYLAAVISDYQFQGDGPVEAGSDTNANVASQQAELAALGFELDSLNDSDRANPRRLQNILQKLRAGVSKDTIAQSNQLNFVYDIELHYLEADFSSLKEHLRQRVREMLPGLIAECEDLLSYYGELAKIPAKLASASGYKQVLEALQSSQALAFLQSTGADREGLTEVITNSHYQLARRQDKWFRKYLLRPEALVL